MRKVILLFLVLISTVSFVSFSQGLKQKLRTMRFTHDLSPIVSYTNRLHLPQGSDTITVHTLGLGISLANGDFESIHMPLIYEWEYVAVPYLKLDFNFANRKGQGKLFTPQDGASPLVLSTGITAAKGYGFLILPFGINGTAGLATDFKDGYLQYGLAWDVVGLSIGIKGMWNFTKSNNSFYKSEMGLELRYIWGWN